MKKLHLICLGILLLISQFAIAGTTGKLAGKVTEAGKDAATRLKKLE